MTIKPMNRIAQRNDFDCGIAATAMIYDMTYEVAESCYPMKCGDRVPGTEMHMLQLDCPECGAAAGTPCVEDGVLESGEEGKIPCRPHSARIEAAKARGGQPYGINLIDAMWVGLKWGHHVTHLHPLESYDDAKWDMARHMIAPNVKQLWTWLEGKRAILIVPNLTIPGNLHFCAWDGRYLVDPLYKRHPARHYQYDDRPRIFDALVRLDTPMEDAA